MYSNYPRGSFLGDLAQPGKIPQSRPDKQKVKVLTICHLATAIYTRARAHVQRPFLGTTWWASTRKVKPIWILLKQETVSGSGISQGAVCKSAPRSCRSQFSTINIRKCSTCHASPMQHKNVVVWIVKRVIHTVKQWSKIAQFWPTPSTFGTAVGSTVCSVL